MLQSCSIETNLENNVGKVLLSRQCLFLVLSLKDLSDALELLSLQEDKGFVNTPYFI